MNRLLLATQNEGKRRELRAVLADPSLELLSLAEFDQLPDAVEDGDSFAANARKKAVHFFELTGIPTVADDSGLVVDALGGRPGVHSARFGPSDAERNEKLLRLLSESESQEGEGLQRSARFVCAICLAREDGSLVEVEGTVEGVILDAPRGKNGFGYDPLFFYPPLNKSFAELTSEQKNEVSHRALALQKLKAVLQQQNL